MAKAFSLGDLKLSNAIHYQHMSLKQLSCVSEKIYKHVLILYIYIYTCKFYRDIGLFFNDGDQLCMTHMLCSVLSIMYTTIFK